MVHWKWALCQPFIQPSISIWIVSELKYICNFRATEKWSEWNESGNFGPFVTLNESIRKFEIDIKYVFIYIYRFSASLCIYVHYKTEHKNARTILNGNEVNSLVILLKHLRSKIFYFELIVFPMEKQIWTAILLKFRISFRFVSEMKSSMINVTTNVYIPNSIAF